MLLLELRNRDTGKVSYKDTYIGEGPVGRLVYETDEVLSVQADGHELEEITRTITGLPRCFGNRIEWWHGDFAKFIVNNLEM